jgi:hypothetical protein
MTDQSYVFDIRNGEFQRFKAENPGCTPRDFVMAVLDRKVRSLWTWPEGEEPSDDGVHVIPIVYDKAGTKEG